MEKTHLKNARRDNERSSEGVRDDAKMARSTPGVMGILLLDSDGIGCIDEEEDDDVDMVVLGQTPKMSANAWQVAGMDPEYVKERLSSPPFVTVDGLNNIRSLGNYPTSALGTTTTTKEGYILRSADLSAITPTGIEQLEQLGVTKIFDLRSDIELLKFGKLTPDLGTSSIEIERIPVFKDEDYSPENLTLHSKLYKSADSRDIAQIYADILESGTEAFRTVFKHIHDHPNKGFLFHCAGGRDRTGVLAALILKVAGVKTELVVEEYALTNIGGAPTRQSAINRLKDLPDFVGDMEGLLRSLDTKPGAMEAFLKILDEKYQGIEGYMRNYLGFTDEDIDSIRRNLLVHGK